ncbi:MAG: polyphenol oxidase family protein [Ferrimicrobium sp.]
MEVFDFPDGRAHVAVSDRSDPQGDALDAALAARLGLPEQALLRVRQVHGTRVVRASGLGASMPEADAILIEPSSGAIGVIATADCVPVVLADSSGRVVVAHAGWRGLVAGVLEASIEALGESTCVSEGDGLFAFVGPHIRSCCYDFGGDAASTIRESFGAEVFVDGRLSLDAIIALIFRRTGVKMVGEMTSCTGCSPSYYSWRTQRSQERMLSAATPGRL